MTQGYPWGYVRGLTVHRARDLISPTPPANGGGLLGELRFELREERL
jgi:hypothetical protein